MSGVPVSYPPTSAHVFFASADTLSWVASPIKRTTDIASSLVVDPVSSHRADSGQHSQRSEDTRPHVTGTRLLVLLLLHIPDTVLMVIFSRHDVVEFGVDDRQ